MYVNTANILTLTNITVNTLITPLKVISLKNKGAVATNPQQMMKAIKILIIINILP